MFTYSTIKDFDKVMQSLLTIVSLSKEDEEKLHFKRIKGSKDKNERKILKAYPIN